MDFQLRLALIGVHFRSELLIQPRIASSNFLFIKRISRVTAGLHHVLLVLRGLCQLLEAVFDLLDFVSLRPWRINHIRMRLTMCRGLDRVVLQLLVLIIPMPCIRHPLVRFANNFLIADIYLLSIFLQMTWWWCLENLRLLKSLINLLFTSLV